LRQDEGEAVKLLKTASKLLLSITRDADIMPLLELRILEKIVDE
jgi:hypothetical protein